MEAFDQALRASLASGCPGIESLAREPALVKASLGLRVGDAKTIPGDGWVQAQAACGMSLDPFCPCNVFCLQGGNMGAKIVEVLEELADGVLTDSILSDARSLVKLLGTISAFYPSTPL